MDYLLQQSMNALCLGGEYALLALGLAIVFSVMGLVNFAHGDQITVGGYAMFLVALYSGISNPALLLPVGVISVVLFALLLERVAFRPVRGAPFEPVPQTEAWYANWTFGACWSRIRTTPRRWAR